MFSLLIMIAIVSVLLLTTMGISFYAYNKIKRKVQAFSNVAFGTDDIVKGLQQVEHECEITPKSVAAATGLYLPNITRDFPDFHYEEMKRRAENVLTSYLRGIDEENVSELSEGTSELQSKLQLKIDMLRDAGRSEHYQSIKIHRTEITSYSKAKGKCTVVFQSSVQYNYWAEQNGQVVEGSSEKLHQSRYNVELIYIQDRELVEKTEEIGLALNCPNCGGPLPKMGAVKCPYCDSPIVEFNIKTWNFSNVQEVK